MNDFTAVIRVVTDAGVDKKIDSDRVLQRSRLRAHTVDLLRVIEFLSKRANTPSGALASWIPPGAARQIVRLDTYQPPRYDPVDLMTQLAVRMFLHYEEIVPQRWSGLGDQVASRFDSDGYPRGVYTT